MIVQIPIFGPSSVGITCCKDYVVIGGFRVGEGRFPKGPSAFARTAGAARPGFLQHGGGIALRGLATAEAVIAPQRPRGGKHRRSFGDGEAEGWQAYAINAESKAPVPWTAESLRF